MQQPALVGDIGGTHARFALTDLAARVPAIEQVQSFSDGEFASLTDAARAYLATCDAPPQTAVFAVASPITGDVITLTNRNWSFTRPDLQQALELKDLRLINDFAAIAWAAPHLGERDLAALHGTLATPPEAPITLIGAGTGLGVALLTGSATHGWRVTPTEGGHASFASSGDEERKLAAWLAQRYGHVSNERVLSGNGLCHIDAALRGIAAVTAPAPQPGLRSAQDVTAAALADANSDAGRALALFCRLYGEVAGDAALLHGARTLLIAGGMVLHFLEFFRASAFMDGFTDKGRYVDYMRRIAVQVIMHPNPGLLGAAVAARAASFARGASAMRC